jgi:biopolymer transport protein ExbB
MPARFASARPTIKLLLVGTLAVLVGLVLAGPESALGYQDTQPPAAAPPATPPTEGTPAEGTPAPATTPAATTDAAAQPTAQTTTMLGMIASGLGWVWGPIFLLLSFVMVAILMMNILALRRDTLLPASFVEMFESKLQAKDYQGAYDTARADDSFVARVLAAGLGRLNRGYEEAIEGMQEVGEEESMTLEHKISYLALIGAVAPMLGLLGTVQGMIASFTVIATSESAPKPKELAAGISTALVTTLAGLIVAIPAMVAFSLLKNRMSRIVLEVGTVSEGLMARFSRKPGGGGTTTAPASPAE